MNGLKVANLKEPSLSDRLLRRKPKDNALLEVQNYLASTAIRQVTHGAIERLLSDYKLTLSEARTGLALLYNEILRYFVRDKEISDDEAEDLRLLQKLMGLSTGDIQDIEKKVIHTIYKTTACQVISDHNITDEKKTYLESLARKLRIPESVATSLYKVEAEDAIQQAVNRALSDRMLSPDEEEDLQQIAKNLGGQITYDTATAETLDRFRLMWRIAEGDSIQIDVPLHLQRGEVCRAYVQANHYEQRAVTRAIRYGGVTGSFRIMKGVSIRAGQISTQRVTEEVLKLLGTGTLYFTNKRLLFDGSNKTVSIPLKKIMNFTFVRDGMIVEKETGKDQLFEFSADIELLDTIMEASMRDSRL